jgi:hypothetical protein
VSDNTNQIVDDPMAKRALRSPQKQPDAASQASEKPTSSSDVATRDNLVRIHLQLVIVHHCFIA